MRSEEEIDKRIEWVKNALLDDDCQLAIQQAKLYAELNVLEWVKQEQGADYAG